MKRYSNSEILFGIARCHARLSGEIPMGIMSYDLTLKALDDYRCELKRRGFVI